MKPYKRCNNCGKPIWDHDYVSIRDSYMDIDDHSHSQCYESARAEELNAERRNEMKAGMLDLDHWLLEEEAYEMNAAFDRKEREVEWAYEDHRYNNFILSLGQDG